MGHKVIDSMLPGKASYTFTSVTVPQTDTGRQVEYTKALERTLVKEGKKLTNRRVFVTKKHNYVYYERTNINWKQWSVLRSTQ